MSEGAQRDSVVQAPNVEQLEMKRAFLAQALKTLEKEVRTLSANNNQGFMDAFEKIGATEKINAIPATFSQIPGNKKLNRYNNIVPYDHSRVKVVPTKSNGNNDYFNGNFLKGQNGINTYIASQAPVPESFPSYAQMLWEQKISTIVMVTNEIEGGKLKCHRYWPDQTEKVMKAGDFEWTVGTQEVFTNYIKRTFILSVKGQAKQNREITQFAFTAWPDHGVPATTQELLNFREVIRGNWNPAKGKVNVHCSAGVGRTGTFIALDRFFEGIYYNKYVKLLDIVNSLRADRNLMVQSDIQFVYLYHICLDGIYDLLQDTTMQLRALGLTEFENQEEAFVNINDQINNAEDLLEEAIEGAEDQLEEAFRNNPQESNPGVRTLKKKKRLNAIEADFSHDVGKPTDDIGRAARLTATQRSASLIEVGGIDSDFWRSRKNFPASLAEKGYFHNKLSSIETRCRSLEETKQMWRLKYDNARTKWEEIQDDGGEVYDCTKTMTPIETRLESLANMEEAWKYRGDGMRSAREEDIRRVLSALTLRLQSLQESILGAEARWRTRGDGMRTKVDMSRSKFQTTAGNLLDRLKSLQAQELTWLKRDHTKHFDRVNFDSEVTQERQIIDASDSKKKAITDAKIQEEEFLVARKQMEDQARILRETVSLAEKERKEFLGSQFKLEKGEDYCAQEEKAKKAANKAAAEQAVKDTKAAEAAVRQAKIDAVEAKKKQEADAKALAAKFMGKLKV